MTSMRGSVTDSKNHGSGPANLRALAESHEIDAGGQPPILRQIEHVPARAQRSDRARGHSAPGHIDELQGRRLGRAQREFDRHASVE